MTEWKQQTDAKLKATREYCRSSYKTLREIVRQDKELYKEVRLELKKYYDAEYNRILNATSIDELNRNKSGIRIQALKNAGYRNFAQIRHVSMPQLQSIKGVGPENARRIVAMIPVIENSIRNSITIRFQPDSRDGVHTQILEKLFVLKNGREITFKAKGNLEQADTAGYKWSIFKSILEPILFLYWFWPEDKVKEYSTRIEGNFLEIEKRFLEPARDLYFSYTNVKSSKANCWDDFIRDAASYYGFVERLWPIQRSFSSYGQEYNSAEERSLQGGIQSTYKEMRSLVEKVDRVQVDLSLMKSQLRGYQLFGTKYAILQKKVLIGDEMGLGKTIQAIAMMTHLKTLGKKVFVVVCPLSIVVNWEREINKHSLLMPVIIHGPMGTREVLFRNWVGSGRVAITTYDTLGKLPFDQIGMIDLLVVDEAHNVKNPQAQRTQYVRKLVTYSDNVIYMTGTPLENRVDEMRFLIGCLNPTLGSSIAGNGQLINRQEFRNRIALVYLRRVREDVLKELPDLIEIEDWLVMNEKEEKAYEDSLVGGWKRVNYMDVRQLSWNVDAANSSKAQKLREICEEAKEDNRKVLVFSFFLNVINKVQSLLGESCIGTITGEIKNDERQRIIDSFTKASAGSVLVCQVTTGGVGLNIQAASVVVFCEPQWKPSTEEQALSRAYRMGQVRTVMVHRLLMTNTIEEKIIQLLRYKKNEFNKYADESQVGMESLALTENQAMAQFVQEEIQKRKLAV